MNSSNVHPRWWLLYLIFPLLIALFIIDQRLKLSIGGHQAVQIAIVVFVGGLIYLWLKANARALSQMDQRKIEGRITLIEIPSYQAISDNKRRLFQLPKSEVKGMLSDTFEMDSTDIHDVSEDLNREQK